MVLKKSWYINRCLKGACECLGNFLQIGLSSIEIEETYFML